jgi:hypothetical protein
MRLLLIVALAVAPAIGQIPVLQLTNVTRPGSDFQVGDRFAVVIAGAANQPVSVRTTMQGRTDWGPVIGWTDSSGRWSTSGQFDKGDFGDWSEVWTVGGKLANPVVEFSVRAPCLKEGRRFMGGSGPNGFLSCETAWGTQMFTTPSEPAPFRTPDGRIVPGRMRSSMTVEQYRAETMQSLIMSRRSEIRSRQAGDEAGSLIMKIIGVNALSEDETRNALFIVRDAFGESKNIPEEAKAPTQTLILLQKLVDSTGQEELRRQIAETVQFILAQ